MPITPRYLVAVAVAVAVAALGVTIQAALAGGGQPQAVNATTTVTQGSNTSISAICPGSKTAVAGGFFSPDFAPHGNPDNAAVFTSGAFRQGHGWQGDAFNAGDTAGDYRVAAYCANKKVKSITATIAITAGVNETTATCLSGTRVVSGGFQATGAAVVPVDSLRKGKRGWRVQIYKESPGTGELTVIVNCVKARKAPKLDALSASGHPSGTVVNQTARCPGGKSAYSGGFDGSIGVGGFGVAVGSIRAGSRGWTSEVYVATGSPVFKTIVYCA